MVVISKNRISKVFTYFGRQIEKLIQMGPEILPQLSHQPKMPTGMMERSVSFDLLWPKVLRFFIQTNFRANANFSPRSQQSFRVELSQKYSQRNQI